MLWANLERRTLDDDTDAFPSPQFWHSSVDGRNWWDLHYLHVALRKLAHEGRKLGRWLTCFGERISDLCPPGVPPCWYRRPQVITPSVLDANVANSLAVLSYYFATVECMTRINVESVMLRWLVHASMRACSTIHVTATIDIPGVHLTVRNDGQVIGFLAVFDGHRTVRNVLIGHWAYLHEMRKVSGSLDTDVHSLGDIIVFITTLLRRRRAERRPVSNRLLELVARVRGPLTTWIALHLDRYVSQKYSSTNPLVHRPPPALRAGTGRTYVRVSAEAAWYAIEKARASRTNIENTVLVKDDERAFGCHMSQGLAWVNKLLQMYYNRIPFCFLPELVYHVNFIADP